MEAFWQDSQDGVLDARSQDGGIRVQSKGYQRPTMSHGGCLMLSTSESHSSAGVSLLSDVLLRWGDPWVATNFATEGDFQTWLRRYYLSAVACRGILRRAERRGKKLPDMLRRILEERASG